MSETVSTTANDVSDPSADVLVEVTGLEVHFPIKSGLIFDRTVGHVRAVDGVDLSIRRGETYGLVGSPVAASRPSARPSSTSSRLPQARSSSTGSTSPP